MCGHLAGERSICMLRRESDEVDSVEGKFGKLDFHPTCTRPDEDVPSCIHHKRRACGKGLPHPAQPIHL